jgi:DNA-binding CsgD family transcriptional regulator
MLLLWAADLSDRRGEQPPLVLAAAAQLVWCHRFGKAEALRGKVADCAPCPLRDLILIALRPAGGESASVRTLLAAAIAAQAVPGALQATVRAALAVARGHTRAGDDGFGGDVAERVLAIDDLDPESRQMARCLVAETTARRGGGAQAALRALEELAPAPSSPAVVPSDAILLWRRGALRAVAGKLSGAADDLSAALRFTATGAFAEADASANVLLAYVQYLMGAWPAAEATADQAAALALSRGTTWSYSQAFAVTACVAAGRGDWAQAEEHARTARRWWRTAGPPDAVLYPALAEATLAQANADHAGVLAALGPLFDLPQVTGDAQHYQCWWRPLYVEALIAVGELDKAASALDSLAALAEEAPCLRAGYGWLAGWLASRQGDPQLARARYEEALASPATPDDIPLLRARLEQAYGELLLAHRSRRPAITWLRRAHARYAALGAAPFLERCAADLAACGMRAADPGGAAQPGVLPRVLSGREHRVAHLVAQGLTNQEVAKELYVSTKTVEYHLSNIFTKLSITSRRQLRSLFRDDGAVREPVPKVVELAAAGGRRA